MPTFSAPLDCTPWVIGGLWPEELSPARADTATLAEYLKVDLQRIARNANDDLRAIVRGGMDYPARRDAEARVIDEARDLAVRRVESTMRQLRQMGQHPRRDGDLVPAGGDTDTLAGLESTQAPGAQNTLRPADMDTTQVIPAVEDPQITSEPVPNDHHGEPQPNGADEQWLARDAAKHRLRPADG